MERRFPIGAELQPEGKGVHFRVWAPASPEAAVELHAGAEDSVSSRVAPVSRAGLRPALPSGADNTASSHPASSSAASRHLVPLAAEGNGYFSGLVAEARAGTRYKIKLARGTFPDPASRYQPDGPHGPSEIIDPAFAWTDRDWQGRSKPELVLYELHVGTFTPEGTWRAAMRELPELARIGITMLEIMPIADFPGRFGWGYDGVDLFAPTRLYGTPDDARAFVNRAHELGLMVILDVVYNHLGPDGNYLREFSRDFFSKKYTCEWGDPINFDGENAGPVREFYVTNARYWCDEFHFDGLRIDATQQIFDASPEHIVAEIARAVRADAMRKRRPVYLLAENETQESRLVRSVERGGFGLDAAWNDDFHHSARVAATGKAECYYLDYRGVAQEFISAAKRGYLFQGQWNAWQRKRRGTPALDLGPQSFVVFLQNHDQIANTLHGFRLHQLTSAGRLRALTALLLLQPSTPLLFQGQEFGASAPFLYFADHNPELRKLVAEGRRKFLQQFRTIATAESRGLLPDPADEATFLTSKVDLRERERHAAIYRLHEDLLALRREVRAITRPAAIDGAVLSEHAFVLRYFAEAGDDRLLIVNLGRELYFNPAPEPLLAPLFRQAWRTRWSSEAPRYGGGGTADLETTANWIIPGEAALLLEPHEDHELPRARLSEKD